MMIINKKELATTKIRKNALAIIESGIKAVLPSEILNAVVFDRKKRVLSIKNESFNISKGRIFVIGGGKASGLMAEKIESIIGAGNIEAGIVNCNSRGYKTKKIKVVEAGHPTPDERGVKGVKRILDLKKKYSITKNDLIVFLISGGGSSLMPCPVKGVSLGNIQKVTELLLDCGAEIDEINIVRKHISCVKGGRLGRYFHPAHIVTLILSDVIGNKLDVIASGPTVPDPSTFQDAYMVIEKYHLLSKAPKAILNHLKKGIEGEIEETPKKVGNCHNHIIGDNLLALKAMEKKAKDLGLNPIILTSDKKGDPKQVAFQLAGEIIKGRYNRYNAIIFGSETTPNLPSKPGRGGRNQHNVAESMIAMQHFPKPWVFASVCTDGSDFLKGIGGAIVDNNSLSKAKKLHLDVDKYIDRYDTNHLLKKISSLVKMRDTGTNVRDLGIYIFG